MIQFDFNSAVWTPLNPASTPAPRAFHSFTAISNSQFFLYGGFRITSTLISAGGFGWLYDAVAVEWTSLTPTTDSEQSSESLAFHADVWDSVNEVVIIHGGVVLSGSSSNQAQSPSYIINITSPTYNVTQFQFGTAINLPKVCAHSATFFEDFNSGNTTVIFLGGASSIGVLQTTFTPTFTNPAPFFMITCLHGSLTVCQFVDLSNWLKTIYSSFYRGGIIGSSTVWNPMTRELMIHGGQLANSTVLTTSLAFYIPTTDTSIWTVNVTTTTVIPVQWRFLPKLLSPSVYHTMTLVPYPDSSVKIVRVGGAMNSALNGINPVMEAMILYAGSWINSFYAASTPTSTVYTTTSAKPLPTQLPLISSSPPSDLSSGALAGIFTTLAIVAFIILSVAGYAYINPEFAARLKRIFKNLTTKKFKAAHRRDSQ